MKRQTAIRVEAMTDQDIQKEVDANYEVFVKKLPGLLSSHRGKFALMHNAQVITFFDTFSDALAAAKALFEDGKFSIQEVTDAPIDLGFFSHALP